MEYCEYNVQEIKKIESKYKRPQITFICIFILSITLNAILLFSDVYRGEYRKSIDETIDFYKNECSIHTENNHSYRFLYERIDWDTITLRYKNTNYDYSLEITRKTVFFLELNGNTYYCPQAIYWEIILLLAEIVSIIFIVRYKIILDELWGLKKLKRLK